MRRLFQVLSKIQVKWLRLFYTLQFDVVVRSQQMEYAVYGGYTIRKQIYTYRLERFVVANLAKFAKNITV